jgi:hypothetical protein
MKHASLVLLGILALGTSACSRNESVGFTGLGGEPASVMRQAAPAATAPLPVYPNAAIVPILRAAETGADAPARARIAIRAGGTTAGRYAPVYLGGQSLGLSVVEVGDQSFAVLRRTESDRSARITARTGADLQAEVAIMTGCLPAGPLQGGGFGSRAAAGQAIALDCR